MSKPADGYKTIEEMAKERAMSLVQWFFDETDHMQWDEAKRCAKKLVQEVGSETAIAIHPPSLKFWTIVNEEIDLL